MKRIRQSLSELAAESSDEHDNFMDIVSSESSTLQQEATDLPSGEVPLLIRTLLPEIWDNIFSFGWCSEFKTMTLVSKYFNELFWHHVKHINFTGEVTPKKISKILLEKIDPKHTRLKTLQITSYGTLHIDSAPEKIKRILRNKVSVKVVGPGVGEGGVGEGGGEGGGGREVEGSDGETMVAVRRISDRSHCNIFLNLTSLIIQRWSISVADVSHLHFPSLTHLTLISSNNHHNEDYSNLKSLTTLRSLTLRFVSEGLLQAIQPLTSLTALNVGNLSEIRPVSNETIEYTSKNGREVTDATFHYLLPFTNLTDLNLSGLAITDRSLERLTTLQNLRFLSLTWCQKLTDKGMEALTALRGLVEVETWHSGITQEGVKRYLDYWNRREEEDEEEAKKKVNPLTKCIPPERNSQDYQEPPEIKKSPRRNKRERRISTNSVYRLHDL